MMLNGGGVGVHKLNGSESSKMNGSELSKMNGSESSNDATSPGTSPKFSNPKDPSCFTSAPEVPFFFLSNKVHAFFNQFKMSHI